VHAFAGTPRGAAIDANLVHYRHLTLLGSTGSTLGDYRAAHDLVVAGDVPLDRLPRSSVPLEAVPAALIAEPPRDVLKLTVETGREGS
jgi:threonine dehydrogenase-like Zn-dependent dehydrogenase